MSYEQQESSVIPDCFKHMTCQAILCAYYKRRATCTADYVELDDHGICIHFRRKTDEPVSPKTDARHNQQLDLTAKSGGKSA